ncbi:hypothetical protein [Fructilactobacillus lindneri]|uniref:hypothetical protein n=1 Tax=Fructilactobacillus lindneri TaxID=53444 RepID=UPI001CDA71A7|nr:hypothetical protein [Fructilactobacillus lindneri]
MSANINEKSGEIMLSNLIYLQISSTDDFCITWGISAGDFVNGISQIPQNVILLDGHIERANSYNAHSKFSTITGRSQVKEYIIGEHKNFNDKWMDYQTKEVLDSLSDGEIADLLYFVHMGMPRYQRNPFSVKLGNEIVYLGGNNGFKRIYFKNLAELDHIVKLSIKRHLRSQRNSKRIFPRPLLIKDLDNEILYDLFHLSSRGLIIPFELAREQHRRFDIPLLIVKKSQGQGKVIWGNETQLRSATDQVGTLTYNTLSNKWSIEFNEQQDERDLNDLR